MITPIYIPMMYSGNILTTIYLLIAIWLSFNTIALLICLYYYFVKKFNKEDNNFAYNFDTLIFVYELAKLTLVVTNSLTLIFLLSLFFLWILGGY